MDDNGLEGEVQEIVDKLQSAICQSKNLVIYDKALIDFIASVGVTRRFFVDENRLRIGGH